MPSPASGEIDTRATPGKGRVPDEGVEETSFCLDLRADGNDAIRCPLQDAPCPQFGFAAPGDGGARSWTLDQMGAVYGQGTLRMVTAAVSLRTMSLTNMVLLPSTRSFNTFSFQWMPDDSGASVQYDFSRED